jgi:hypothetical protein
MPKQEPREKTTYYVDREMCGDVPKSFDLGDFCCVLQEHCDAIKLDIEIEAVTGSVNGAWNEDTHVVSDDLFLDALCRYCEKLDARESR